MIFNEAHCRRALRERIAYYNTGRPHQGLTQRTPIPINNSTANGSVRRRRVLGGIQNDYYRDAA